MKICKLVATFAVAVASLAGIGAKAADQPFVIKYANIPWFDPVYIADEKGWFADRHRGAKVVPSRPLPHHPACGSAPGGSTG